MKRLILLGSITALIAACSSRTTTYAAPSAGGSAGTGGSDSDGGTSSGGKGSGGANAGGSSSGGKANGGTAGDASGGTAGSGEAGMGGEAGPDDCPTTGCPPSCEGLANDCGPDADKNCCASIVVPASVYPMGRSETNGDTDFFIDADVNELPEHTATVLSLRIDTYEATLGRFEKFVAAMPGSLPAEGDGAHPGIANSGWQAAWDDQLDSLTTTLLCENRSTWTSPSDPAVDRHLPMNCVSYYIAFAFCAWDGGFLPTEADWEAIAAGGDENRLYPWGAEAPDAARTNFNCEYDGNFVCDFSDIPPVGTFPNDRGRWGHFDLGGGMSEWVLDAFTADWYSGDGSPCTNCANPSAADLSTTDPRILRGSNWYDAINHRAAARRVVEARELFEDADLFYGVRCARSL